MSATERRVFFLDVVVKKMGRSTTLPPITELLEVWQEYWKAGKAFHVRAKGNVLHQITDIQVDDKKRVATILLSVIDKTMPDAAYGNLDDRKIRILPKADREGGNVCAHLVISLDSGSGPANTYLALLESVRGIAISHVQFLLNQMLRAEYKDNETRFTYPDVSGVKKDGTPKRHPYLPLVAISGHISEDLIRDLEHGTIRNITLTKATEVTPFAEDPYLEERAFELKIGVRADTPREGIWDRIKNAAALKKDEYSTGRISFRDPNEQTRNVVFDVDSGAVEDSRYIKSEKIGRIFPLLADASEHIVTHFADRMVAIIERVRGVT